jgi:hypothetical protein
MFVLQSGGGYVVNQILQTKTQTFNGQPAEDYARKLLIRQRSQEAIHRAIAQILAKAGASVRYNPDFAPGKPAAPPPAPAS